MKLLKSKFATAFVLAGLMFGMLSFTTTPVAAQDTNSNYITMEEELAAGGLGRLAWRGFTRGFAAAVAIAGAILGDLQATTGEYPSDSLDP